MSKMFASVTPLTIALPRRAWADWAGMIASIGCAIHCAAMPLVLAYLPTLGLSWLADEVFHKWDGRNLLWARRRRIYSGVEKARGVSYRRFGEPLDWFF